MNRYRISILAAAAALLAAPTTGHTTIGSYTDIADTATSVPGHDSVFFSSFNLPSLSGTTTAFSANFNDGRAASGVYSFTTGQMALNRVADDTTVAPGQTSTYTTFGNPTASAGAVAFQGAFTGGSGVYTFTDSNKGGTAIADTTTTASGETTPFAGFSDPAVSGSNVLFTGSYASGTSGGAFTGTVGAPGAAVVADTSSTSASRPEPFTGFATSVALSGTNVFFVGQYAASYNGGGFGIFARATASSELVDVVDTSTTVPNKTFNFSDIGTLSASGTMVAFNANSNNGALSGIYTARSDSPSHSITLVADTTTIVKGPGTPFTSFGTPSLSGTTVAFVGRYSGGEGLFLSLGGTLEDLIDTGSPLFGSTVTGLAIGSTGLDGDTLAFIYELADGQDGIAEVTVPEPSTWAGGALLLATAALSLRRRRQRSA